METEKAKERRAFMTSKMINMMIIGLELPICVFLGIFLVYEFVPRENSTLFSTAMLTAAFLGLILGIYIFMKISEKYTEKILEELKTKQF
ncbi:MAG: hypothetical protein Q6356_008370 [Candidatus Wukongarchaeota archaeon]|jgi:uncharacterized protein YneF (UPF0154 family)|nr:hypothetical protein [Candidatus Wukongarchaeota archaeon]